MLSTGESYLGHLELGRPLESHLVQLPLVPSKGLVTELGQDADALRLINYLGVNQVFSEARGRAHAHQLRGASLGPLRKEETDDLSRSWVWEQNNVTQRHGLFKKSPELLPGTGASTNAV